MAAWERAGFKTDWRCYDYQIKRLFLVWQQAEYAVNELRQTRLSIFIKSWLKEQ